MLKKILSLALVSLVLTQTSFAQNPKKTGTDDNSGKGDNSSSVVTDDNGYITSSGAPSSDGDAQQIKGKYRRQAGRSIDQEWTDVQTQIQGDLTRYKQNDIQLDFVDYEIQRTSDQIADAKDLLTKAQNGLSNKNISPKERTAFDVQVKQQTERLDRLTKAQAVYNQQLADLLNNQNDNIPSLQDEFNNSKQDKLDRIAAQKTAGNKIPDRFLKRIKNDSFNDLVKNANEQAGLTLQNTHSEDEISDYQTYRKKHSRSPASQPVVQNPTKMFEGAACKDSKAQAGVWKNGACVVAQTPPADGTACKDSTGKDGTVKAGVCIVAQTPPADGTACKDSTGKDGTVKAGVCIVAQTPPADGTACKDATGKDGTVKAGVCEVTPAPQNNQVAVDCDKVYVELAKLILEKPENSKILSNLVQSAAVKMSALSSGMPQKSVEEYANNQKAALSALSSDATFTTQLTNMYLGSSGDVQKVISRVSGGKANYYDKSMDAGKTARFTNQDSSALVLALAQNPSSGFTSSDAAAVWAQNKILAASGQKYGSNDGNLMNFSTQVYHLNNKWSKRDPASIDKTTADMIQKEVTNELSRTDTDALTTALKNSSCLKQADNQNACTKDAPTIGSESIEKIKEKVAELASTKQLQGLTAKYQFDVKDVKFNSTDGSYTATFKATTQAAQ